MAEAFFVGLAIGAGVLAFIMYRNGKAAKAAAAKATNSGGGQPKDGSTPSKS